MHFPEFLAQGTDTTIHLSQEIYDKMLAYTQASKGEISGWGKTKVTKDAYGDKIVTIVDIRLFKQRVQSVHTSLDGEALTKFYIEMANTDENMSHWNHWWHSHNDMPAGFSSIDDDTIKKLKPKVLYSTCINKTGDIVGRVDTHEGVETEDVEVRVERTIDVNLQKACAIEVKEKVKYEEGFIRVIQNPQVTRAMKDYIKRFRTYHNRGWGENVNLP